MKVYQSYLTIMVPYVLLSSTSTCTQGFLASKIHYPTPTSFIRKRKRFPPTNSLSFLSWPDNTRLFFQLQNITSKSSTTTTFTNNQGSVTTLIPRLHANKLDLNLLLLDNYDSYTYNLYSYLSTICIRPPTVISNDAYDSWENLIQDTRILQSQAQFDYDGIIISPGPGRPDRLEDIGICLETITKNIDTPILGVCLGHQALGHIYNASVTLAPCGPVHGLLSQVWFHNEYHTQNHHPFSLAEKQQSTHCDLFQGISQGFPVVRYHSLTVNFPNTCWDSLDIEPIAWCIGDSRMSESEHTPITYPVSTPVTDDKFQSLTTNPNAICMALRHKKYPHYGVQFHPESIGTGKGGYRLLENFCEFCSSWKAKKNQKMTKTVLSSDRNAVNAFINKKMLERAYSSPSQTESIEKSSSNQNKYKVLIRKISSSQFKDSTAPSPQSVFEELYESMEASFWLDSSNGKKDEDKPFRLNGIPLTMRIDDSCPITTNSRFSILGGIDGPLCKRIEYYGPEHKNEKQGLYVWEKDSLGIFKQMVKHEERLLTFLHREMKDLSVFEVLVHDNDQDVGDEKNDSIAPFKFRGGYVGYLGYEFRHDTRLSICDQEICKVPFVTHERSSTKTQDVDDAKKTNPSVPTAAFIFADRSLVYDHWRDDWYTVAVTLNDDTNQSRESELPARKWIEDTSKRLQSISVDRKYDQDGHFAPNATRRCHETSKNPLNFELLRSQHQYEIDIARCLDEIKNGESYELCLTNKLSTEIIRNDGDTKCPFGLYKVLRRINPAPYSAYLNFGGRLPSAQDSMSTFGSLSICCSSPELFLSISKGITKTTAETSRNYSSLPSVSKSLFTVESKPIKGTSPRKFSIVNTETDLQSLLESEELRRSVKNRAENLMIVDLLRNDLSRVCEPGSVHVPKLMQIESYATVHQMVSTVRGFIDSSKFNPIDVISACFPGGSMTGAPKLRSVDILDGIEQGVSRGPYSGCLGYISLDGCMDMNIVIRTAILTTSKNSWDVNIGAGGAITALSEPGPEFDEMLLKARALITAVNIWDNRH